MELDIKKSIADAIDWAKTRNKKEKLYFSSVCETLVNQNYEDIKDEPKIKQLKKVCEDVGLCFTDYEIYGNKTNDLNDKLNFFRKGTDDVTKKVFIERYELLEHINEIDFSPSQGISFKSNIAKINYNDFCNLEYFSKDNIYFINCALNYIKIKDLDYLKKIYSDEEERDVENETEDIYIYYAGYKVKKGSESNEILYLTKTILNPQILVDDMLKHFYLCIAMDYGGISCKTLMKIEDKNSKAYYNLLQNLKAFKYGMKYIEKEYIKSINISNEIDYKFLDGKLIIQYSNIDNIVDFFNKRKYKPIFIEQDLIQDCFDNHYMICLMYNNINYLSFYLTKKTEDNQYHIDIVHLNHEIKSIVDSISKGNAKFKEEAPKKINKIYSTITDAFSSNDCISEVQIISPGYNHATGMHKKEVEDVCFNLVYEKFNNAYSIVRIKGYYCKHCRIFFDFEDSFKQQLDLLRINPSQVIAVYCNEKMEYLDGRLIKTTDNLAAKSILGRFGYSTNKRSEQRHSIIDFVLEYKYASKVELVNLLSWLIRFNGARAHEAKLVWERDIMYINQKK